MFCINGEHDRKELFDHWFDASDLVKKTTTGGWIIDSMPQTEPHLWSTRNRGLL